MRYSVEGKTNEGSSEVYVCPKGFAGKYRVRIHRVWGEVAAGKVTVDVYTHLRSGEMQHERQQLEISDKDAMVVFDLNHGRRSRATRIGATGGRGQATGNAQPHGAGPANFGWFGSECWPRSSADRSFAARRAALSRSARRRWLPADRADLARRHHDDRVWPSFRPIGVMFAIAVAPIFSTIGDVQTFTFAGAAQQATGTGTGLDRHWHGYWYRHGYGDWYSIAPLCFSRQ